MELLAAELGVVREAIEGALSTILEESYMLKKELSGALRLDLDTDGRSEGGESIGVGDSGGGLIDGAAEVSVSSSNLEEVPSVGLELREVVLGESR